MVQTAGRKKSRLVLSLCLAFTITGTTALLTIEAPGFDGLRGNELSPGGFFTLINPAIDWLAEDNKSAAGFAFLVSQRGGILRVFVHSVSHHAPVYAAASTPQIINKYDFPVIKNTILLNLRI